MSKKISILLPVFNCGLYIKSAIQSIINNSFENYEIIVINDGSTDNTLDIINQFNDPRIKIYNKDELLETVPIYAAEKVKKINFLLSLFTSLNYMIWGDV